MIRPAISIGGPTGLKSGTSQRSPSALKATASPFPYIPVSMHILKRREGSGSSGSWITGAALITGSPPNTSTILLSRLPPYSTRPSDGFSQCSPSWLTA